MHIDVLAFLFLKRIVLETSDVCKAFILRRCKGHGLVIGESEIEYLRMQANASDMTYHVCSMFTGSFQRTMHNDSFSIGDLVMLVRRGGMTVYSKSGARSLYGVDLRGR